MTPTWTQIQLKVQNKMIFVKNIQNLSSFQQNVKK